MWLGRAMAIVIYYLKLWVVEHIKWGMICKLRIEMSVKKIKEMGAVGVVASASSLAVTSWCHHRAPIYREQLCYFLSLCAMRDGGCWNHLASSGFHCPPEENLGLWCVSRAEVFQTNFENYQYPITEGSLNYIIFAVTSFLNMPESVALKGTKDRSESINHPSLKVGDQSWY